jgi:cytochrome b involved in lipid metabolism
MMDWVRLKQASKDLAQLKGSKLRPDITLSEVATHKTLHDCWIVLRGVVYNIGPYLAYHPGGKNIIFKLAGTDCTAEFDKYHRWVNIEGLVGVLKVGYLAKS